MKRMLTACRMRNALTWSGVQVERMQNVPLEAGIQMKRMLTARRIRNTPLRVGFR